MSEVKDRHCCGECKAFIPTQQLCLKHIGEFMARDAHADKDLEACSDFEPKGGWQE